MDRVNLNERIEKENKGRKKKIVEIGEIRDKIEKWKMKLDIVERKIIGKEKKDEDWRRNDG